MLGFVLSVSSSCTNVILNNLCCKLVVCFFRGLVIHACPSKVVLSSLITHHSDSVAGKYWIASVLLWVNFLANHIFYTWTSALNMFQALKDAKYLKAMLQRIRGLGRRHTGSNVPAIARMKALYVYTSKAEYLLHSSMET